jgi:hypothetical protein
MREGFRKDWWFPRNRRGSREGQRCFKNEGVFQEGLRVSDKSRGFQRRTEGFREG